MVCVLLILTAAPSSSIIGSASDNRKRAYPCRSLFPFLHCIHPHHLPYTHTMIKIWSMKAKEAAAEKKKPKTSAAQIRVQKGICNLLVQSCTMI